MPRNFVAPNILIAATLLLSAGISSAQENWTRFHGDNGSGLALTANLPTQWTTDDYAWEIELPGVGSSAPIVWKDRIFLTSSDPETAELTILCISAADGKTVWNKKFDSAKHRLHRNNNFASSTLAADKDHVYAAYANNENTWLIALDHDGNEKWKRNFGTYVSSHGFGSSPVVVGDKVILMNSQQSEKLEPGQQPGTSRLIAVNAVDGSQAWTTPFDDRRVCYGVPCVLETADGKKSLICTNTVHGYFSVDVDSGEINWTTPTSFDKRIVASSVIAGGLILNTAGSGGGGNYLVAIRPDPESSTSSPKEVYRIKAASYVPSPIVVDDLLFMFNDKGIVMCHDLATGAQHYRKRIGKGFSGSPVANASHVYCMSDTGDVHVVGVSKEFQHHVAAKLGQPSRSTPTIVGNRIYFRTETRLFALDGDTP
jgi:hypothetical protein